MMNKHHFDPLHYGFFSIDEQSGLVHWDCDFGGGLVRLINREVRVNDGFYHRIRGFRRDFRLVLEVDRLQISQQLTGNLHFPCRANMLFVNLDADFVCR